MVKRQPQLFALVTAAYFALVGCGSPSGNTSGDNELPDHLHALPKDLNLLTTCQTVEFPGGFQGELVNSDGLPKGLRATIKICLSLIERVTPTFHDNQRSGYVSAQVVNESHDDSTPVQLVAEPTEVTLATLGVLQWGVIRADDRLEGLSEAWTTSLGARAALTGEVACVLEGEEDTEATLRSRISLSNALAETVKPVVSKDRFELATDGDFCR